MISLRRRKLVLAAAFLLYLLPAGALSYTKRPWADEAWFANISYSMLHNGNTGISVLDPRGNANMLGREFPQIDQHYYIWIPVHEAAYALWYEIAGFDVLSMRAFSILWGLGALIGWFFTVRTLTGNYWTACLAVALIATDFAFLDAASDGRMDIMVASLSSLALALYLRLREQSLNIAIVLSQSLVVIAGLTHPMGAIGFLTLWFLTLFFDWRRIRFPQIGLIAIVYLAGTAAAAAYILPGLDLFRVQLGAALTGRLGVVQSAGNTVLREFSVKYRSFYLPPYASGIAYTRLFIPFIYAGAIFGLLTMPSVRSRPGSRVFLGMMAVAFLSISILDSGKLYYYMVHITPFWAAALALWVAACWPLRGFWRAASSLAAVTVLLLHLGWVATAATRDPFHKSFLPMARFMQQKIQENRYKPYIVTSSAELGFVVGFQPPLVDDALLGFASGKNPDVFVVEPRAYGAHYLGFVQSRPEVAAHIHRLEENDRKIFDNGWYQAYERKSN
jgi:hypothetical protein